MSGKPAARVSDPTACPLPGHGTNPIAAGSGDVFFDGLPAARQGDASACGSALVGDLATTVLINGKPAATVGSVGAHGNKVTAGSGTVIIGNSHSPAPFSGLAALAVAAALDYRLGLKSGGNSVLTPLEIPDFDELKSGASKNRELVDFVVENRMDAADNVKLEVLDGEKPVYTEANTAPFLPPGKHPWQWDGYDTAGILDTKTLKSPNLKLRLTATGAGKQQVTEVKLACSAEEVKWVDVRIDRNAKTVEVTLRPSFSEGGSSGSTPGLVPTPFSTLLDWAKEGIELYWSRNGARGGGIAEGITTSKGVYKVTVKAEVNVEPKAGNFPLIDSLSKDFGRSTSLAIARKVYHNAGYAFDQLVKRQGLAAADAANYAQEEFKETSAHEFGHLILNEYGGGLIPNYSWTHKETSTLMQNPKANHPTPSTGEVDVMHYFSSYTQTSTNLQKRMAASEQDVKSLLWLARVEFDD
ncbi:PAAR domain-containing protein [Pseudomonas fluorescens]|nr:PAAR domain-containing protein [Pseudomonas fluorescens]QTD33344.1 PAAR domain-containing protein [Pseudomonas fluorescens]